MMAERQRPVELLYTSTAAEPVLQDGNHAADLAAVPGRVCGVDPIPRDVLEPLQRRRLRERNVADVEQFPLERTPSGAEERKAENASATVVICGKCDLTVG